MAENQPTTGNHVYAAIADVAAEMASDGISKSRTNTHSNYKFRGIDDVYNSLAPVLAKHRLVIIPRFKSREVAERRSRKDEAIFYVTVQADFDFVSAVDGSKHTASTFGEAMDSSDKATNKAMSAAYKYACFQTFCIPTEGDNDADSQTLQVKAQDAKSDHEAASEKLAAFTARFAAAKSLAELEEIWPEDKRKQKPKFADLHERALAEFDKYKEAFELAEHIDNTETPPPMRNMGKTKE